MTIKIMHLLMGIGAAVVVGVLGIAESAHAQVCGESDPQIVIETSFDAPRYDFSYGFNEIQVLGEKKSGITEHGSGRMGNRAFRPSDNPMQFMGLTAYRLSLEPSAKVSARKLAANSYCAQISEIHIQVSIVNQAVYVAREYPKGSCSHKDILEHEKRHVATNKAFLPKAKASIQTLLNDPEYRKGISQAYLTGDPDEMRLSLEKSLREYMAIVQRNLDADLGLMQSQIDSRQEYERVMGNCDGITQKVLTAYFDAYHQGKAQ